MTPLMRFKRLRRWQHKGLLYWWLPGTRYRTVPRCRVWINGSTEVITTIGAEQ